MDKQASKIVKKKILQESDIPNSSVLLKKKSVNCYEIHIIENPKEKDWLAIEDIIFNHNLKLRIKKNLIIY
jgi:hypothetical protein